MESRVAPPAQNDMGQHELALLGHAFERFQETGAQLEAKHAELQQEVLALKEKLQQKEDEVKRNERLATLGNMAAAIAHEVRNPLGALKLFLSLLRRDFSTQQSALELVKQADCCVTNIDNVVGNILQFAGRKEVERTLVNATALVSEVCESMRGLAAPKLTVTNGSREVLFTYANQGMLRQALLNLVQNSCQACCGKGEVTVECRASGQGVLFIVSDNGPGVPAHLQEKIFEPFVTGRSEGTGLGLAIVKQIALGHGGQIEFESSSKGAVFKLVIPHAGSRA